MRLYSTLVLLACLLLLPACSSEPKDELASARKALEAARTAEADLYAPDAYESASRALKSAEAQIAIGDYTKARALLARATSQASLAASTASTNKAQVKAEAQTTRIDAQAALDAAKEALRRAIKRSRSGPTVDSLQGELTDAEVSFNEANTSYADGKYLDSRNQFNAVKRRAAAIAADIEGKARPPQSPLRPLSETAIP
ncbi:MAG: DUF4398 domain-containing protein [Acidobacteria bacterium]|nr:MAG: DUF4398 domain-containing protein [Acidobacteriota bacterium]